MKITLELTNELIETLSLDQAKIILKQITSTQTWGQDDSSTTTADVDVDERIEKIKAEIAIDSTPQKEGIEQCDVATPVVETPKVKREYTHGNQMIPNHIIEEIQSRYDNGNESLLQIIKDYPQYKYRTLWSKLKLTKRLNKREAYNRIYDDELILAIGKRHIAGELVVDLAEEYQIKRTTLYARLLRLGIIKKKSEKR
jgi:hypothetical protein